MSPARLSRSLAFGLLAIATLTVTATDAHAIVVIDTFDSNTRFSPFAYNDGARVVCADELGRRTAAQFTVNGGDVLLSSVTLPIGVERYLTPVHRLRVRIASDDAGRPGATIEVLSLNQNIWAPNTAPTAVTLNSTAHPLLSSGTSYWLVIEPSAALSNCESGYVAYHWMLNTTGTTTPHLEDGENGLPVDPWPAGPAVPNNKAFRIEGEATVDVDGDYESPATLGTLGPMPFSQSTTLEFSLPAAGPVSLAIYDLAGRRVRTLVDGSLAAGRARRTWDGRDDAGSAASSGLYFARLRRGNFETTHKLLLAR